MPRHVIVLLWSKREASTVYLRNVIYVRVVNGNIFATLSQLEQVFNNVCHKNCKIKRSMA
jgi:hypothetical protein